MTVTLMKPGANTHSLGRFRETIQTLHASKSLNYRDEHFEAYFYPMPNLPCSNSDSNCVEGAGDDPAAGWMQEAQSPVTPAINKLKETSGLRHLKISSYWVGNTVSRDKFAMKLRTKLRALYDNRAKPMHIRSAVYAPKCLNEEECAIDQFDGRKRWSVGGVDARTHEKNLMFAFGAAREFYSITGSTNLAGSEFLYKANNQLVIRETTVEHPIYLRLKDNFYRTYGAGDGE